MKSNDRSLGSWVTGRVLRGNYLFTKEDLTKNFEGISPDYMKNSISRLIRRGVVMSPWRSFYVAVPEEYRLNGHVPPSFYIDRLMSFVNRPYYVALLSAGASFACAAFSRRHPASSIPAAIKTKAQILIALIVSYY